MRLIAIRWTELEIAFERNAPDMESFLDGRSGEVVTVATAAAGGGDNGLDNHELRQRIAAGGDAYIRIEPASSREQYRWMERFVTSVSDEALRDRLLISIDGKGAFRRFKDVLLNYPVERERWFSYRAELLHWHMQEWLKREDLTPQEPPPWQPVIEPPELEAAVERPPAQSESPGDLLRRQARELIDQIPAVELPAAIAYLDFLRERSMPEPGRIRPIQPHGLGKPRPT